MAVNLKEFQSKSEYESYIKSLDAVFPNVSIDNALNVYYNEECPYHTCELGDILYYNDGLNTVPYTEWDNQGEAVGVCVISSSHASVWGNGIARFVALNSITSGGNASSQYYAMNWGNGVDTPLKNYPCIPNWPNMIDGAPFTSDTSFISTDKFTDKTPNVYDSDSQFYYIDRNCTYSPYCEGGLFFDEYRRSPIWDRGTENAFADFDGKENTSVLVELGSNYIASHACRLYSTNGIDAGKWYLPSMGELGYLMVRLKLINEALAACGGNVIPDLDIDLWSSTEVNNSEAWCLNVQRGRVYTESKTSPCCVLPFVQY